MGRYISRQLASIVPTIFLSVVINFILLHAAPGDPARVMAGRDNPTEEQIAAIRVELGLDQPLPVQFWHYLTQLFQGNMGESIAFKQPVFDLIMSRLPATLMLTITSALLAFAIGTFLGVVAAQRAGSARDTALLLRELHPLCHSGFLAWFDFDGDLFIETWVVPNVGYAHGTRGLHGVS